MEKFNYRIGNIEVRSCDIHLTSNSVHDRAEIVKWNKKEGDGEYCYTLAYFIPDDEHDFNLKFVGDRPHNEGVSPRIFMHLAETGYRLLVGDFEEPKEEE